MSSNADAEIVLRDKTIENALAACDDDDDACDWSSRVSVHKFPARGPPPLGGGGIAGPRRNC